MVLPADRAASIAAEANDYTAAEKVACKAGIDEARAKCLPEPVFGTGAYADFTDCVKSLHE